jgi:hypothetical protein
LIHNEDGQQEANAARIAVCVNACEGINPEAVPDLLAAMKGLFEHCVMIHSQWGDGCNQKEADDAISKARAALAKAQPTNEGAR